MTRRHTQILLCLLFLYSTVSAFYASNSKVVQLTASNFKEKVLNSNQLWLVEFYAPWCGHCKSLKPIWETAAKGLEGIINVGAVDMTTEKAAGAAYGIKGFPTLKFFGNNKNKPTDYTGGRDVNSIINFVFERAKLIAKSKANYKGGSKNSNSGQQKKQEQKKKSTGGSSNKGKGSGNGKVITLTDSTFASQVYNSDSVWMVEFYAPWCGHCKRLLPEWEKAAKELTDVKWGKVDCTVEKSICGTIGVNGYPTIKAWTPGAAGAGSAEAYSGNRDKSDLIDFASALHDNNKAAKELKHMKSHAEYKDYCIEEKGVCFIFFIPHILDSSEKERKETLDMLTELTVKFKGRPVSFLWSQGGDQYSNEEKLGLTAGYPAALSVFSSKKKYVSMLKAFTKDNIINWVEGILRGKQSFYDLPAELPEWNTVKAQ